jgi:DNA-binding XRE family transcriptional regulator
MTAVDSGSQPGVWRIRGPAFAAECRAIAAGVPAGNLRSMSPLRAARLRRRLKQKQVAYILGISELHVGRLERGERRLAKTGPELQARIRAFIDG